MTPDLPNTKQVLHAHAYQRDANPTAQTHEDGLAARLDQFDNVGVEANRRHGHDNEELGKSLDGGGHGYRQGEHGGNDARQNEEKDEEREDLLDVERARGSTVKMCIRDRASTNLMWPSPRTVPSGMAP